MTRIEDEEMRCDEVTDPPITHPPPNDKETLPPMRTNPFMNRDKVNVVPPLRKVVLPFRYDTNEDYSQIAPISSTAQYTTYRSSDTMRATTSSGSYGASSAVPTDDTEYTTDLPNERLARALGNSLIVVNPSNDNDEGVASETTGTSQADRPSRHRYSSHDTHRRSRRRLHSHHLQGTGSTRHVTRTDLNNQTSNAPSLLEESNDQNQINQRSHTAESGNEQEHEAEANVETAAESGTPDSVQNDDAGHGNVRTSPDITEENRPNTLQVQADVHSPSPSTIERDIQASPGPSRQSTSPAVTNPGNNEVEEPMQTEDNDAVNEPRERENNDENNYDNDSFCSSDSDNNGPVQTTSTPLPGTDLQN